MSLTVEVGSGRACILELSNTDSKFLFKVSEAKEEGGVSASLRKYPILNTDSIDNSVCKTIGSSRLTLMSLCRRWQKNSEEKSRIYKMG